MNLSFEHGLSVRSPVRRVATSCALSLCRSHRVESALGDLRGYHGTISCLLLDRDDDLAIALTFLIDDFRHALSPMIIRAIVLRSVRWCIQVRVLFSLILHLELSEECLLELCLLRGANRLAGLHSIVELVKEMLIEVISVEIATIPPKVHIVIGSIGALMAQPGLNRTTILVVLATGVVSTVVTLSRIDLATALTTTNTPLMLEHR